MIGGDRIRNEISGGIFFSAVIQGGNRRDAAAGADPGDGGLRDASEVFAGRDDDLERFSGCLILGASRRQDDDGQRAARGRQN